jgi:hypothetical protein
MWFHVCSGLERDFSQLMQIICWANVSCRLGLMGVPWNMLQCGLYCCEPCAWMADVYPCRHGPAWALSDWMAHCP